MWQVIRTVVCILLVVIARFFNDAGFAWIDVGYGLHPAIAFPLACACMFMTGLILVVIFVSAEDEPFDNLLEALLAFRRMVTA